MIRLANANVQITQASYGPFDNNYIVLGLSNGSVIGLDSIDLNIKFTINLFSGPVKNIEFDPTNLIFVSSKDLRQVAALSLIEKKVNYVYLDLGNRRFGTVCLDN